MARQFVHGFKEADKLLAQLPRAVENRVLQKSVNAGARAMRNEVKKNAPRGTGKQSPSSKKYKRLFKNIKVQVLKSVKAKGRRGARVYTANAFWGLFLEFGTRHIAARPWFRPSIDASKNSAVKALKTELGKGIEKEATKLAKLNRVK